MSTAKKVWIIVAGALILVGALVFVTVMSLNDWDFMCLSSKKFQTKEFIISDSFENIEIKSDTAKISFLPSTDGNVRVVCYEEEKIRNEVSVIDGTLSILRNDTRKWYDHIGIFNFGSAKITVYLPEAEYGALKINSRTGDITVSNNFKFTSADILVTTADVSFEASTVGLLKIHTNTGDIKVGNTSVGELDLEVSTGDITVLDVNCLGNVTVDVDTGDAKLENIRCKSLISKGDTGYLVMNNVLASEKFHIERDTGDVKFTDCDAAEIDIETSTGDVIGSFLVEKVVFASTDTGRVDVPKSTSGGRCEITTDTGDIKITVSK